MQYVLVRVVLVEEDQVEEEMHVCTGQSVSGRGVKACMYWLGWMDLVEEDWVEE